MNTLHSIDSFGILKVSLSSIRIERLEDRIKPGVPFPHKHDFFQIMLVTAGTGWHQIDFKKHKLTKGQVFLMKPGQMHSWDLSQGVKGFIVEFNHQSLNASKDSTELMNRFSLSPDVQIFRKVSEFNMLQELCLIMISEFERKLELHDLCLQGYLMSFIIQMIRGNDQQLKQEKTVSVIERFKKLIEKNYRREHAVEFYAKELKVSSKALTMQLTRSMGKSPRLMIQERILLEAKRFLSFSQLSVSEIGYELGFEDANYFTRFFRLHEGISPAQFRKKHQ